MSRVLLAMSGGVDSSVSAWLLREAGHEVIGLFMRHGQNAAPACDAPIEAPGGSGMLPIVRASAHKQGCCTASDAADARRVADLLDIPFYAVNFEEEFSRIMDYFAGEYSAGRTPNPCVRCNDWLKFGRLVEYADSLGAEWIATGHYARIEPATGPGESPALLRGVDAAKDQSYVLFVLDRAVLPRVMFPVGGRCKEEIRQIARRLGFRVADKKDSQEICFVPGGDYAAFIRQWSSVRSGGMEPGDDRSGDLVLSDGTIVGRHEGIEHFTVGQRRGLGVAFGERRYVMRIDAESRRVTLGSREELAARELSADDARWLVDVPREPFRCQVKIRYRSPLAWAHVEPLGVDRFVCRFDEPQVGVAPGQAAVCYQGDRLLGGGWIA
jgi:tRNA-specific 2-thiouridylase